MNWNNGQKTVEELEAEIANFKKSMNDWVIFLGNQYKEINERMSSLERRMAKLEMDSHFKL